MLDKVTRENLNQAGWNFTPFSQSSNAADVRQNVTICQQDANNNASTWVTSSISVAATAVATYAFPPLGLLAAGAGYFFISICKTHKESAQENLTDHLTPYKASAKGLFYLGQFEKALQKQQELLSTTTTPEKSRQITKDLESSWNTVSVFLNALPNENFPDELALLQSYKENLLKTLDTLKKEPLKNAVGKANYEKKSAEALKECVTKFLQTVPQMLKKQAEIAKFKMYRFQQRFESSSD